MHPLRRAPLSVGSGCRRCPPYCPRFPFGLASPASHPPYAPMSSSAPSTTERLPRSRLRLPRAVARRGRLGPPWLNGATGSLVPRSSTSSTPQRRPCARQGMAGVRQAHPEDVVIEVPRDPLRNEYAAGRHVARRHAPGEGHRVRQHVPVLAGESGEGAAESGHTIGALRAITRLARNRFASCIRSEGENSRRPPELAGTGRWPPEDSALNAATARSTLGH